MKRNALDLTFEELRGSLSLLGEKEFRVKQIYKNLHKGLDFSEMTDISLALRERLAQEFFAQSVKTIKTLVSADGTEKFLFLLNDGNVVEGVLMKYKYGYTLCISTQVGCRMNCAFCASCLNGLVRNMTSGEMIGEIVAVNRALGGGIGENRKVINVVMMGSGEPLDNYDETLKFLKAVSCGDGINISQRNVSLSTCGLVRRIYDLADAGVSVNLTVSLHSPFDEERERIMPVANKYSIREILDGCAYYFEKTGRRYIFEYVLIKGENDTERHANELIKLLKGRPCHVNLIRLNEVKESGLKGGSEKDAYRFLGALVTHQTTKQSNDERTIR